MLDTLLTTARNQIDCAPVTPDLTREDHLDLATTFAAELLADQPSAADLRRLEETLAGKKDDVPLLVHLGVKLALSRQLVQDLEGPAHLSVVFAVYKEHQRILSPEEATGGEDFLRRKVAQLQWLFAGRPDMDWDMFVVDDGCPEGSGQIAAGIIAAEGLADKVQVLHLAEAIAAANPLLAGLSDPAQSMKGGSIQLGMWEAARPVRPGHVVLFTDADLSTHLGQCGLLMAPILDGGVDAAIGSRRLGTSVAIKQGRRNDRGKLFIYLWKRIIGIIPEIIDTQCGFKAFSAELARDILPGMLERKFAFDIELLIKTAKRRPGSIQQVGIAWIDSEALSTTTDLQPYLPMLQAMVKMYRAYLVANPKSDEFATFLETLDDETWGRLLTNIPADIVGKEPAEFVDYAKVGVRELANAGRR